MHSQSHLTSLADLWHLQCHKIQCLLGFPRYSIYQILSSIKYSKSPLQLSFCFKKYSSPTRTFIKSKRTDILRHFYNKTRTRTPPVRWRRSAHGLPGSLSLRSSRVLKFTSLSSKHIALHTYAVLWNLSWIQTFTEAHQDGTA